MSQLSINTTQNVAINFDAASIGDRILGCLLDTLIKFAYGITVILILENFKLYDVITSLDQWSAIAIFSLLALPVMLYSLIFESLWEGQTIGKKIMKIKVIKLDGYQASFGDYLMRWLFRLIDVSISYGVIGVIFIVSNKNNQRLGDIAAGTAVISLKKNININHTILQELSSDYVPVYPLVIKLSDNDVRIIKETFDNAKALRDYNTIIKLKNKIIEVTQIKSASANDIDFISTILKDYNFYTQKM